MRQAQHMRQEQQHWQKGQRLPRWEQQQREVEGESTEQQQQQQQQQAASLPKELQQGRQQLEGKEAGEQQQHGQLLAHPTVAAWAARRF